MSLRKFTAFLLLTIFIMSLAFGQGCLRQQPAPLQKTKTPMTPSTNVSISQNIARISKDVNGVKNAYVVVSGKTALIGLVVAPKLTDKQIANINRQVDKRTKAAHNNIKYTAITEKPQLVARIKRIVDRIAAGRSVSNFGAEITSIIREIRPAGYPMTKTPATTTATSTAQRIAQIAKNVKGVDNAYVTISDKTALIGLVVAPKLSNREINNIKVDVDKRVRAAEKSITRTVITENPDLVARIKAVGEQIAAGKPLSAFTNEIGKIIRRITPATNPAA